MKKATKFYNYTKSSGFSVPFKNVDNPEEWYKIKKVNESYYEYEAFNS